MKNKVKERELLRRKTIKTNTFVLLIVMLFISLKGQSQEIVIETGNAAYYCNSVITLIAPQDANHTFSWVASGSVSLKEVGTNGNGFGRLNITGSNKIDVIVKGKGKVIVECASCGNPPSDYTYEIPIEPTVGGLNPQISIGQGSVNYPNGIQTEHPWICLGSKASDPNQVVTIKNPTPFGIFWSITGGAIKISETYESVGGEYVATVTIKSDGSTKKGFIRAYLADPCGNFNCGGSGGSGIDWEILKNIAPDDIFGVTCLRDNNLDGTRSTVYSIPDELAGNAVFEWAIVDENGDAFDASKLSIGSEVLYGNSATITYIGNHTPSSVGNFTVRATNAGCGNAYGEVFFEKEITVSPEDPVPGQETYCASATVGATVTVAVDSPSSDLKYTWATGTDVDWNIVPIGNGSTATVTFNDIESGILVVKAISVSNDDSPDDLECSSSGTVIYINRTGGDVSVVGVDCIKRGTTEAFTFTASPFGLFEWEVVPALPTDWSVSNVGNILTVTPPPSGIEITGNYTVTATLQGCTNADVASFDFEIGPNKPNVNGENCVMSGTSYGYEITSIGATNADVSIVSNGVATFAENITLPGIFDFVAASEDFVIKVVAYSNSGCASLSEAFEVKVKPTIAIIRSPQSCGDNPEVTFTTTSTGSVSDYKWEYPTTWERVSGGQVNDNFVTLRLDGEEGDISVTPVNNGCFGDEVTLNVPSSSLNVVTSLQEPFPGFLIVTATSENPLEMTWYYGKTENSVADCNGTLYEPLNSTPTTSSFKQYIPTVTTWLGLRVTDPITGCSKCYTFNPTGNEGQNGKIEEGSEDQKETMPFKASFEIKAFPNPTSSILNVSVPSTEKVEGMVLVNSQGKSVFRKKFARNKEQIDVSNYSKGMYYLYVQTVENGFAMKKIIIE